MKKIYSIFLIAFSMLSINLINAQTPIITAISDGDCSGGNPKVIEIYAQGTVNFADYSLELQSNANTTWGATESLSSLGTVTDAFVYVYSGAAAFATEYPNVTNTYEASGVTNFNGDDRIRIINSTTMAVIDMYGEEGVDGTGTAWEYKDGFAYRVNTTGPDAVFNPANWSFHLDSLNTLGVCQGGTETFETLIGAGSYQYSVSPTMNLETSSFTMNEADPTTNVTRLIIDPAATSSGTYEIHLVGGTGSAADLDLTAFGATSFPLTLPYSTGNDTLNVPITPNNDAVYEGTETFEFVLRNATGGLLLGADSTFTLTMTDDELPPDTIVNFNPTMVTANEGAGTVDLTLEIGQLSAGSTTFTVDVALSSGDATDIDNYTTQTVSFPAGGATTQTLTINITDDALVEGNETLIFMLTNPSTGLTLGTATMDTLVIIDNDAASADLATVGADDGNGNPVNMGQEYIVYGVVNSGERGYNSSEFSIQDATGGITVYDAPALTYDSAKVGDSIMVQGIVGQRFGVTILTDIIDLQVLSSGHTVTPATVTTPNEMNESTLIEITGLTLTDAANWTTSTGGAGFDVEVYSATDTFNLRVDRDYLELYDAEVPGCVINVIGVAGQYDADSAFTSGYQILPRSLADITVVEACEVILPSLTTIGDATEVDSVGDPVMYGQDVMLKGIITSPSFREGQDGTEFTFADNTGGIWAYSSSAAVTFTPVIGDSVMVIGNIFAANGVTRIGIDSVMSLGAANPISPVVVTTDLDESHEAELITLENLTLTGAWDISGGSFNVSATGNGTTYDIRVDANRATLFAQLLNNGDLFNITGVGSQYDPSSPRDEGYQILPRFADDVEKITAIKEINLNNLVVSPIPATDVLNVSFDFDANEQATIQLVNVIGKVVANESINLVNGNNTHSLNVSNLNAGFYVLQVKTNKGASNTNVIVK